jgi:hypothetical protein
MDDEEVVLKFNEVDLPSDYSGSITFDRERKVGFMCFSKSEAYKTLSEAKARIAEGWKLGDFIREWF